MGEPALWWSGGPLGEGDLALTVFALDPVEGKEHVGRPILGVAAACDQTVLLLPDRLG